LIAASIVPKEHLKIARHFNAGCLRQTDESRRDGCTADCFQPSLRDSSFGPAFPALKRRAIVSLPLPGLATDVSSASLPLDAAGKEAFHSGMKRIFTMVSLAVLTVSGAFAQDATQQQIDKLSGQIQDLLAAQERQTKQMAAIEKEISDLREKVNAPQINNSASREDLKNLAEQVQEIDKNRQADRKLILKEIDKLGKVAASGGGSVSTHKAPPKVEDNQPVDAGAATPQKGYYYTVQPGNTVSAIAKAYQDQGVKVTTEDILKANPKLDPNKLFVGQKVFIPDPNAK
jgi:LysM repeat protein